MSDTENRGLEYDQHDTEIDSNDNPEDEEEVEADQEYAAYEEGNGSEASNDDDAGSEDEEDDDQEETALAYDLDSMRISTKKGNAFRLRTDERLHELPVFVDNVLSEDTDRQLKGTVGIRKLLSIERNAPIAEVVETGVLPRLVQFLERYDNPELQYEAAWALTNVASGTTEQLGQLLSTNALPLFVELIRSERPLEVRLREQCVWALGNISGDSSKCRDQVHALGAIDALSKYAGPEPSVTLPISAVRNIAWTASNLARGKPIIPAIYVQPTMDLLCRLIDIDDEEVLTDLCWGLSYLSDGPNERIQILLDHPSGVIHKVVRLLGHHSNSIVAPALRTVANVFTGDDRQTQAVIDAGALQLLAPLLRHHKKGIKKETCWAISNVTAGTQAQIQAVFDAGLMQPVMHLLHTAEFDIRKEAAWAITNATTGGTHNHIKQLVDLGCIKPLVELLSSTDPRIISVALEGLENILKAGSVEAANKGLHTNPYLELLEGLGGEEKIEALTSHYSSDLAEKAKDIYELFWGGNLPPAD